MSAGMMSTIKTFVQVFGYFAAFQIGKMTERPRANWPRAKDGQNPFMVGDWDLYRKIYIAVVILAIVLVISGGGMFGGGMGGGFGGY